MKNKVLTQWGSFAEPFSSFDDNEINNYIISLKEFIETLRSISNFDIFITYGTLLGAIRDGKVIPHDFDFDLAVVVKNGENKNLLLNNFNKFIIECRKIPNVISITPASSSQYAISLKFENLTFTVDLFLSWFENNIFFQNFSIDRRFNIKYEDIFPLTLIEINGIELPCPSNSNKLLSAIYGDDWITPNPNFNYRDYFESLGGVLPYENTNFGRLKHGNDYWNHYYLNKDKILGPSQFAIFSESFLSAGDSIIEVGSGDGRDTFYLASHGYQLTATDYSDESINLIKKTANKNKSLNINAYNLDYANIITLEDFCKENLNRFDIFYSRFLFHAVSECSQINLLKFAKSMLKKGGLFLAEFRSQGGDLYDKKYPWNEIELTGDHYRRPIDVESFICELSYYNFNIEYKVVGRGYAYHQREDPLICRIVAKSI